ncbi:MAG TPA: hypothetical protein VEJ19_08985 [Nitrososphaerales archaeon]|nr:hypothetical protein [Nitrososphaerales archaeon]
MSGNDVGFFLGEIPVLLGSLAWALGYGALVAEAGRECPYSEGEAR